MSFRSILAWILPLFFVAACAPAVTPVKETVRIHATSAAQPWLSGLYQCAADQAVILAVDPLAPQIALRLGEPQEAVFPSYQVGSEQVLVVVHRDSGIQTLTSNEVQALFTQPDAPAEILVYASEEDAQQVFEEQVLLGAQVTSLAGLAADPAHMMSLLEAQPTAVGLLPGRYLEEPLRSIYSIEAVPVLALTPEERSPEVLALISCLQLSAR